MSFGSKTGGLAALMLVVGAWTTDASAQIYRWVDESGRTIVSDTPPPDKYRAKQIGKGRSAEKKENLDPVIEPLEPAEKAALDPEVAKRVKEEQAKAEQQKRAFCAGAQQNLALLESGQPVSTLDASGNQVLMDNATRAQEIKRLREQLASSCK